MEISDYSELSDTELRRVSIEHVNDHNTPEGRSDVYELTKRLAGYCMVKEVQHVVCMDRSARLMGFALSTLWDMVPAESVPKPAIHNIDPTALAVTRKQRLRHPSLLKSKAERAHDTLEEATHPLLAAKDENVALVDVCSHSGLTLTSTKKALGYLGFKHVSLVAGCENKRILPSRVDHNLSGTYGLCCGMFGLDLNVKRVPGSVLTDDSVASPLLNEATEYTKEYIMQSLDEGVEKDVSQLFSSRLLAVIDRLYANYPDSNSERE